MTYPKTDHEKLKLEWIATGHREARTLATGLGYPDALIGYFDTLIGATDARRGVKPAVVRTVKKPEVLT